MTLRGRLTLGQQLMVLVVGLVLALQIANVVVSRVDDVHRILTIQESDHLMLSVRAMRSIARLPEDQREQFAAAQSSLAHHMEWGTLRPLLEGDARRPEAESEALQWFQNSGLPVTEIVMTERAHPSPPPPPGPEGTRPFILGIGERPRTLMVPEGGPQHLPVWVSTQMPAPADNLLNLFRTEPRAEVHRISLRHRDSDHWLTLYQLRRLPPANAAYTKLLTTSIVALCIALVVLLVGRRVMRPLRRLSSQAERLGRGETVLPLNVEGPSDTRKIISSFNRMNERVTQSVDYQIGLLRSLGHDLSGPLARVRTLAGSIQPDTTRAEIETRLNRMQDILASIMEFSRSVMRDGDFQTVDLALLLEVVVEESAEAGADAQMAASDPVMVSCRVNAIQRCLANLVENACKYGGGARAAITKVGDEAVVRVDDDGPGIPEEDLERIFQPFERLSQDTPGSGLGLAIVKTIVVDQGGNVRLINRPEGGLRVELRLPIEQKS